jgi:hypothetical protein
MKYVLRRIWLISASVSSLVESQFKKARFKKESRFKKDCCYNRFFSTYRKIASSNTSRLEAHVGFFRLLMKGIFGPYVL